MSTVNLGTYTKTMRLAEISDLINTDPVDVAEAIITAIGSVAISLVGGLAGTAYGIATGVKTLQDIQNMIDSAKLGSQAEDALNEFENNGCEGYIKCTFQKEKWVSSNGNIESGIYSYPIHIYYTN